MTSSFSAVVFYPTLINPSLQRGVRNALISLTASAVFTFAIRYFLSSISFPLLKSQISNLKFQIY